MQQTILYFEFIGTVIRSVGSVIISPLLSPFWHRQRELNSRLHITKTLYVCMITVLTILFHPQLNAKTSMNSGLTYKDQLHHRAKGLENKMTLYLENKVSHKRDRSGILSSPSLDPLDDFDMFILARTWNSLSPSFKKLYAQAVQIPDSFSVFISPGGNFEIYYTTKGIDGVSPDDFYMFNLQQWQQKVFQSNGIPDYIDEVAWAFDSTWSMEIDKFNFKKPYPLKTSVYNSDRYKVIVAQPDFSEEYGFTMISERAQNNGFSSFITIRNDWSKFTEKPFKYDTNPLPAIQVTCAHEFFHAIQYSMSWEVGDNTQLDNFPLAWIEGSAVTMEELAFPEVNDYVQYAKAYFNYPQMSFFSLNSESTYSNSLFLIYTSTRSTSGSPIDFIKQMHVHNFQSPAQFASNIEQTSLNTGAPWSVQLNKFHTSSYFAGNHADTTIFISDAALFSQWSYLADTPASQMVGQNSMRTFSYTRKSNNIDTLFVFLKEKVSAENFSNDNSWAATSILRTDDSTAIIPIALEKTGAGSLTIPQWSTAKELIVIATSGFSNNPRKYEVDFVSCPITYAKGSLDTVFLDRSSPGKPSIAIQALDDLRCPLTITDTINATMSDIALQNDLTPINDFFSVYYPPSWGEHVKLLLLANVNISDTVVLSKWDQDQKKWLALSKPKSDSVYFQTTITDPGIYGLFYERKTATSGSAIVVFPNPIHIHNGSGFVNYAGNGISDIAIYAVDGSLIYKAHHTEFRTSSGSGYNRYRWNLKNSNGRPLVPGVYSILVRYSENTIFKTVRKKLLLIP